MGGRGFGGLIDDFRFYDLALSEGEVAILAGIPEPQAYLLAAIGLAGFVWFCRRQRRASLKTG